MRIFGRLLALFLLIPAIELVLLVQIGRVIGFWSTVAIIILSGLVGTYLVRREGMRVWRRFNEKLTQGSVPGRELMDGLIVLIAGVFLLTPGVITDLAGLLGLFPPTRALIRRVLSRRLQGAVRSGGTPFLFTLFGPGATRSNAWPTSSRAESAWSGTPTESPRHAKAHDKGSLEE